MSNEHSFTGREHHVVEITCIWLGMIGCKLVCIVAPVDGRQIFNCELTGPELSGFQLTHFSLIFFLCFQLIDFLLIGFELIVYLFGILFF